MEDCAAGDDGSYNHNSPLFIFSPRSEAKGRPGDAHYFRQDSRSKLTERFNLTGII